MNLRQTSSHILLIGLAAFIFLLAALALSLLQEPPASLPWAASQTPNPLPSATDAPPIAIAAIQATHTPRTSYTPFATRLTVVPEIPQTVVTAVVVGTSQTPGLTPTSSLSPTITPTFLPGTLTSAATATPTPTPTASATLEPGESGISGRVVLNGAPVPGVKVSFRDDQPPRTDITDDQGRYWFTTLATGVDFQLSFEQDANPQYSPSVPFASTALLFGYLPTGNTLISLPDLEISLVISGQSFEPTTPISGAAFIAANITSANPIQFVWTTYNQAEDYYVELCPENNADLLWASDNITSTNIMFNGTLDDGSQITAGTYEWFVTANRMINDYYFTVYTQPRSLVIVP